MNINILTDSTSDITQAQGEKMNLKIVPLKINFENIEYKDGINITSEEFYLKLQSTNKLPITSQPSPDDFLTRFEEAKNAGDVLIVITLSSNLSGTYQSAILAKDICDYEKIYIIDSSTVSMGLNLLVHHAVKLRDAGETVETIVSSLEEIKHRIRVLAIVDTLEYLKKGGRLSSTAALAGTLLSIKPIIKIDLGVVCIAAKTRGKNSAYSKVKSLIEESGGIDTTLPYILGYTGSKETILPFKIYLENACDIINSPVSSIGSTVGVHAGPGACGIAYFVK